MDRFWSKVDKSGDCWEWTAYKNKGGYGCVCVDGKQQKAHRVSYILHHGSIPNGLHVLHRCDNPKCVNPKHLFLGTHADNMADKARKGRARIPGKKGTDNGTSKLMDADIINIRAIYKHTRATQSKLADIYSVSQTIISDIVNLKSWRHV